MTLEHTTTSQKSSNIQVLDDFIEYDSENISEDRKKLLILQGDILVLRMSGVVKTHQALIVLVSLSMFIMSLWGIRFQECLMNNIIPDQG